MDLALPPTGGVWLETTRCSSYVDVISLCVVDSLPHMDMSPDRRIRRGMYCPYCKHPDSRVLDSRVAEDGGSIRRRRQCPQCERRFTTVEQIQLMVVKRSGVVEPFLRDKIIQGVRKACKGRPVSDADLAKLGQQVEDAIRSLGLAEVPAEDVGVAILDPLRELDEVAYLRFASVYEHYSCVEDFESTIAKLRQHKTL